MELSTEQKLAIVIVGVFFIALVVYLYMLSAKGNTSGSLFSFSFFNTKIESSEDGDELSKNPGS